MTAHSRKNKRGRTEIDIATAYFEEEKERTKKLMAKKITPSVSVSSNKAKSSVENTTTQIVKEKKKKKFPKFKSKRLPQKKSSPISPKSNKLKKQKIKSIPKKNRERKKRKKRARNQYFQRYNI